MTISPEQLAEHIAEMNIVATNAMQNIAKAARRAEDVYGNRGAEEEAIDDWGILGQRGRGGLGDADPQNVPKHRPVPSAGYQRLSAESDTMPGDGSTRASAALSRELGMARAALKSTRRALEEILAEEPLDDEPEEVNQRRWPSQDVSTDDLMSGRAMQRASVNDLMAAVAGRGSKALPAEKLSALTKSAVLLAKGAARNIDAASNADELDLRESIAASSLLGMLQAGQFERFAENLELAGPNVARLFDF